MDETVNFKSQLRRQLGFVRTSCTLFDQGYTDEAIRIALGIRVILHDTKSSTSVLKHLRIKDNVTLISTILPNNLEMFPGFCGLDLRKDQPIFPLLGNAPKRLLLISEWWEEVFYVTAKDSDLVAIHRVGRDGDSFVALERNSHNKVEISRKNLIIAAANTDGGAHVDKELPANYKLIANDGSLGMLVENQPLKEAHLVAIRQIGFEILNSPDILSLLADETEQTHIQSCLT